ncbi:esterase family protein [Mycobacterium hodleri]|uniref:alpha/beta hydrolase n=1 Tax=Mycolicibacterium hodleri TaxID=49897 RepID=UPI0021F2CBAB|nr:esterase family protein [Mycolicibacterium hodleri]
MHGWFPWTVQVTAAVLLVFAIGLSFRRWWTPRLAAAVLVGVLTAAGAHHYVYSTGLANDASPGPLWFWLGLAASAGVVTATSWRGARWWRRGSASSAVALCLLSAALLLNSWVGYVPTVYSAWNQLTAGRLPHEADPASIAAMQRAAVLPANGAVVAVSVTDEVSKFRHRGELVYLPPAWFATMPPPSLPVVMMIGAEINTPADWLRIGGAATSADEFAAAHGGNAPVLVFVDTGGAFGIDTECVNGVQGNAADHLTKEVIPFMIAHYGVSADPTHWGVAGFSTGGTCALDLTVMHPDLFSSFVDIAGDAGPNAGSKEQTIIRLFGGDAAAWASFDPATVIIRHGPYRGVSGRFVIAPAADRDANVGGQDVAAHTLCDLGRSRGIDCAVVTQSGNHDWLYAAAAFRDALPWLAEQLGTPATQHVGRPGQSLPLPPPSVSPPPDVDHHAVHGGHST